MSRFKVVDQDSYVPAEGVILPDDDIVERDGYCDTATLVQEMMLSGQLYEDERRKRYEYPPESEIAIEDMTLAPVVDEINLRYHVEAIENMRIKALDEKRKLEEKEKEEKDLKERETLKEELKKELKNESAG